MGREIWEREWRTTNTLIPASKKDGVTKDTHRIFDGYRIAQHILRGQTSDLGSLPEDSRIYWLAGQAAVSE
jgi:hypothetical protein